MVRDLSCVKAAAKIWEPSVAERCERVCGVGEGGGGECDCVREVCDSEGSEPRKEIETVVFEWSS